VLQLASLRLYGTLLWYQTLENGDNSYGKIKAVANYAAAL
jgi:hypothetical protein